MKELMKPIKAVNCLFCGTPISQNISFFDFLFSNDCLCTYCKKQLKPVLRYRSINDLKVFVLYDYNAMARESMLQYKGCFDEALAPMFLHEYRLYLKLKYAHCTLIPMPSSKEKRAERGFDHVISMFQSLGLPIVDCLEKVGNSEQKNLSLSQRSQISEVIRLRKNASLPYGKVVLIDDVCTSGNTLLSAYLLLKDLVKIQEAFVVFSKSNTCRRFPTNS